MNMKQTRLVVIIVSLVVFLSLMSCEKHDDTYYFKSKCEAVLNGVFLIDQTPFNWAPTPNTPYLQTSEYEVEFNSHLSTERGRTTYCCVVIKIFADKPWSYLTDPQVIKFVNIDNADNEATPWDYKAYCWENKINYAEVLITSDWENEIVKEGCFQITSYDREKGRYKGNFTLQLSKGTLKGEFLID